jgi:hypothetical protein
MLPTEAGHGYERSGREPGRARLQPSQTVGRFLLSAFCFLLCAFQICLAQTPPSPLFSPRSGASPPVTVTLSDANPNALIRYTLDGTLPNTSSTLYTGPLTLTSSYTVVRASAFVTGQSPSTAVSAYYYNSQRSVPPTNSYTRTITKDLPATPLVTVQITNAASISCYTVEERLPGPLQPVNITGGGVWNPATGTVRWGPLSNTAPFIASYRVTGPPGSYSVDGSEWADGQWTYDPGATVVPLTVPLLPVAAAPVPPPQVASPVFSPRSGTPIPAVVSISDPTPNAVICYTLDGTLPDTTSTLYTGPITMANSYTVIRAAAFVTGDIPSDAVSAYYYNSVLPAPPTNFFNCAATNDLSGMPVVSIQITNAAGILCYSVEERLPGPLQAVNITGGGVWNPATGTVRWGPLSNTAVFNATFGVTGPLGAYSVSGLESADGRWTYPVGPTLVTISPPAMAVAAPPPAPVEAAMPVFSPASGTPPPVVVTMTNVNPAAVSYYTLDGTAPNSNSIRYLGPITISSYTVIRARSYVTGESPSASASAYYYASAMGVPPANSSSSGITNDLSGTPVVTVQITNAPSVLCYSVEERLPAPLQASNVTGGGVWNPAAGTVRWGPLSNTAPFSATFAVTGPAGAYSVSGSESVNGQWTLELAPALVTIAPSSSAPPSAPEQVAMPAFSPLSGAAPPVDVSLSCATTNVVVTITYTLDGSEPAALSQVYAAPLHFDSAAEVRARAFADGLPPSAVSVAFYGPPLPPADLQFSRALSTSANGATEVSLTVSPGATAHCFAVEESLPAGLFPSNITAGGVFTASNSVLRWGPFTTTGAQTLAYQAAGLAGDYQVHATWSVDGVSGGEIQSTNIVLPIPTNIVAAKPGQEPQPVFSPAVGGALPVAVTISCSDPQAQLFFTSDGSAPTQASSHYSHPLTFSQPAILRARAFANGSLPSAETAAYYGQTESPPDFQVSCALNLGSPLTPIVNLTATPGSTLSGAVCYAVEEWLPPGVEPANISSGGVYAASESVVRWGPFIGTTPVDMSWQAVGLPGAYPLRTTWSVNGVSLGGFAETSLVIGANSIVYVPTPPLQEPPPVLSPAIGSTLPVNVSISCSDSHAQIRYTLDGSSPASGSALYTSPLTLTTPCTLRARSFSAGWTPSTEAVGFYIAAPNANSLALVRSVSGDATSLPIISVTATPRNIQCYALTETLASGLTPYRIGQNGVWDSTNRTLKWGPYTDAQSRVLTYQVTGPSTAYPLDGQGSFDGNTAEITGATNFRVDQTTVIYDGNTNNGFGGAIGNGSLVLSDDGTNLYGTLNTSGPMANALVLYIATGPGGFASTAGFQDAAEPLRTAISGYTATQNDGGPGQSVLTFESGFAPSYAIALQPGNGVNFGGLWGLSNGGNYSLPLITSVNLTPVGTDAAATYRFSFNVTNIGLTPGAGQSFELLGTFISDTGFRSTEAVAGNLTGIQGWNPFTQTAYATYTMIPAIFPLIVAPPAALTVHFGQSAQFVSGAIGAGPMAFQWQCNGTNLTNCARLCGCQSNTLTIAAAQLSDAGTYQLIVTNAYGSVTSATATLIVIETAPVLSSPQISATGQFTMTVASDINAVFNILVSTDLVNWRVVSTFTNLSGNDTITLPVPSGNQTAAFYRLISH